MDCIFNLLHQFVNYRNKGTKTVEEELLQALKSNNLITDEGFDQIQTMHFQRAARTDKGVSALRQIISLLLRKFFSYICILVFTFYHYFNPLKHYDYNTLSL